jgi:hypothetical protein
MAGTRSALPHRKRLPVTLFPHTGNNVTFNAGAAFQLPEPRAAALAPGALNAGRAP